MSSYGIMYNPGLSPFSWYSPGSIEIEINLWVIVTLLGGNESYMMTASNGSIFCITGPFRGESTGHQWIPLTKANDVKLWCFPWSAPGQRAEQTIKTLVIWDAIALIMMSLECFFRHEFNARPRWIFFFFFLGRDELKEILGRCFHQKMLSKL